MPDFVQTQDFLSNSTALRQHLASRVVFNPLNDEHIKSLKEFIRTGNWGDVRFFAEAPYTDVPTSVLMKFASQVLGESRNTLAQQSAHLSSKNLVLSEVEAPEARAARIAKSNEWIHEQLKTVVRPVRSSGLVLAQPKN